MQKEEGKTPTRLLQKHLPRTEDSKPDEGALKILKTRNKPDTHSDCSIKLQRTVSSYL